jgi:hypothetical protein
MTEGRALRRIADPVVAGAPAGVRIRTRIHPVAAEAAALAAIGELLGSVYRCELAGRVRLGWLDPRAQAAWRAERKRAVTGMSSSRWAGAITRAVEDQYQLGMRGLACYVGDLRAAIEALEHRCALGPGELALASDDCESGRDGGRSRRWRGYRSRAERFAKTRRLAILRGRLAVTQEALSVGRPSVTVGGKRLWRNRNHLAVTGMSEQQWRERWCAARMFLTADGESGKAGEMRPSALTGRGGCALRCPRTWSTIWAATSRSVRRCSSATAPGNGAHGWRRDKRCDMTSATIPTAAGGISTPHGLSPRRRRLSSTSCGPAGCWAWISTPTTWPPACWTLPATRLVFPSLSASIPRDGEHRGVMAGSALPSPRCWIWPPGTVARRSWWRTLISPTRVPLVGKRWAAGAAGNGCGVPSLGFLALGSAVG